MHFIQIRLTTLAAAAFVLAGGANAATITFDDLVVGQLSYFDNSLASIPQGYAGFNWQNMWVSDMSAADAPRNSGYGPGTISHNNLAFNAGGSAAGFSSTSSFNLENAYFTAAWNDGLEVEAQGFANGVLQFSTSFLLDTTQPSLITFNWDNITAVTFSSMGGTPATGTTGAGTHFALDNLSVSPVPESSSILMSLVGILAMGSLTLARARSKKI